MRENIILGVEIDNGSTLRALEPPSIRGGSLGRKGRARESRKLRREDFEERERTQSDEHANFKATTTIEAKILARLHKQRECAKMDRIG